MLHDTLEMFRQGEVIPFVILALLCVGIVIILEKFMILQFVYNMNFEKFSQTIKRMLLAGDTDRARSFSKSISRTGLPMIAVSAIDAYEMDPSRVRAIISEEGLRFIPRIRRRLSQLPNLAAGCVIIGVLATIQGIWETFKMVEGLEIGVKSFVFSSGLTHAMLPLVVALFAAFVIMIPYGLLDAMSYRIETEIEHGLAVIVNILAPDTQAVFAQPSAAGSGYDGPSAGDFTGSKSEPSAQTETKEIKTEQKASENVQASQAPRVVPDEEEII